MSAPEIHRASFEEIPRRTLYDLLRLRSAVFVVEQDCVFLDLDDRDHHEGAEHLWAEDGAGVTSTLRLLPEGEGTWSVGRVVTRPDRRGMGLGGHLLRAALGRLADLGCRRVVLGAQAQLIPYYRSFGFVQSGPRYLEDGILHAPMVLVTEDDRA